MQKVLLQPSQGSEDQIQVWKIKNHLFDVWFCCAVETWDFQIKIHQKQVS